MLPENRQPVWFWKGKYVNATEQWKPGWFMNYFNCNCTRPGSAHFLTLNLNAVSAAINARKIVRFWKTISGAKLNFTKSGEALKKMDQFEFARMSWNVAGWFYTPRLREGEQYFSMSVILLDSRSRPISGYTKFWEKFQWDL